MLYVILEWTVDTHSSWDGSQGRYVEQKKPIPKVTYCMIPFIHHSWNNKIEEMENRLVVARHWLGMMGTGVSTGVTTKGHPGKICATLAYFCILIMVVVTKSCTCDNTALHHTQGTMSTSWF